MRFLLLVAGVGAFLPFQNPPWPPSYAMNQSTLSMACNSSGWFDVELASQIGIVSFDWSNHKASWAAAKPMTCEEDLVTQASMVAARNGPGRVFTYFNLVKALPWYTSVRELIADPAYSGFFLRFNTSSGALPHMPPCDPMTGECSSFYHDQLQTPAVPGTPPPFSPDGVCVDYCDCGQGVPCGEYLWDLRNISARSWLVNFLLGPSFLGAPGGIIHGMFIDVRPCVSRWFRSVLSMPCRASFVTVRPTLAMS